MDFDMVDTGINVLPSKSLECKNLLSTKKFPDDVTKLVDDELRKGYLIGPFTKPPFDTYRISPIGIVEGKYSKKKRLILDLSAPHNNDEHHSINDLINKEDYSLTYVRIDDAINIIKSLGIKSQLCKCDVTDAFKLIPVHNSLWRFYGLKWNDMYYFYTRLAFGCRSSPKIFDTLSVAICWILQNNYGLRHVLHLLDDFLLINNPYVDATRNMNTMLYVFNSLKIPLSAHKTVGPSTSLEYLGIILDSMHMIAKLPDEKLVRIKDILYSYLNRRSCTKREMLSLLGHLNYACKVIIPGRSFVSYLLTLAHSVKELYHHVTITKGCRDDMAMWFKFLSQWNEEIVTCLQCGFFNHDYMDLTFQTACVLAFYGFLRCNEFTCRTVFDPDSNLCVSDINFVSECEVTVNLKATKTDIFRQGIIISLFKIEGVVCPYKLLSQLMSVRLNLNAKQNDSFLVEETGKPLSRNYFISKLKTILIALGYSDKDYSGHSFRSGASGAATSAGSQGIEDSMIQTLGRWKSDCFKRYIRTFPGTIL
ncbi:unnamed protein product [Mytilus edulis]|uniref:Reverse transcriptase domain-containing protein n=1 Tax=Mytilus edulis TaxID=6550 RepID=A0A8S3TZ01_MYTED|nr:unnamed protein product [Mytilus edulis]